MTTSNSGLVQLDRMVDSIRVGRRHRTDLGDLDALAASIGEQGLLQPITITPDGVLICGARRLAAVKLLGWRQVNVWVRSNLSETLAGLIAERDENTCRKQFTKSEQADLYAEMLDELRADAARRQHATQFPSGKDHPRSDGAGKFPAPSPGPATQPITGRESGRARVQAAAIVGGASHRTLDKILTLRRIAHDPTIPTHVRDLATTELAAIDAGAPVHPAITKVHHAHHPTTHPSARAGAGDRSGAGTAKPGTVGPDTRAEAETLGRITGTGNHSDSSLGRAGVRAFGFIWRDLAGWSTCYDPAMIGPALTQADWDTFHSVVQETLAFHHHAATARQDRGPSQLGTRETVS
jgi:ParB family chromosome partitioning protein